MEEIKVGEYVRTKSGFVGKVIGRHGGYGIHYELDVAKEIQENFMNGIVHEDNIVKHSKNIIDLVECGDYANGMLVTGKESTLLYTGIKGIDGSGYHIPISQYGEGIQTILTHEQFEQNSYKV